MLSAAAFVPMLLVGGWVRLPWVFASFFGGMSPSIIVGVSLDALRRCDCTVSS